MIITFCSRPFWVAYSYPTILNLSCIGSYIAPVSNWSELYDPQFHNLMEARHLQASIPSLPHCRKTTYIYENHLHLHNSSISRYLDILDLNLVRCDERLYRFRNWSILWHEWYQFLHLMIHDTCSLSFAICTGLLHRCCRLFLMNVWINFMGILSVETFTDLWNFALSSSVSLMYITDNIKFEFKYGRYQ